MKRIMYALFTTKNSKIPRHIYARAKDAEWEMHRLKELGISWGLVKRVEVVLKNEASYDIYYHEYERHTI